MSMALRVAYLCVVLAWSVVGMRVKSRAAALVQNPSATVSDVTRPGRSSGVQRSRNATASGEGISWYLSKFLNDVSKSANNVQESLKKLVAPDEMPLTMRKCTKNIGSSKIGTVSVECEDIGGMGVAYHCGLKAQAEGEPTIARRYDLGPRPFQPTWNPLDVAAIAIECTETPNLHGAANGTPQIPWHTALPQKAKRELTFDQLENFIKTRRVVGFHYDLIGGNCQHFSFRMYELLMKLPCYSLEVPNSNTIEEIAHMASTKEIAKEITAAAKLISQQFQKDQNVVPLRDCDK